MSTFDEQIAESVSPVLVDAFGIEVTYKAKSGGQKRINAVFDNGAFLAEDDQNGTIIRRPTVTVKAVDVPNPVEGDLVHVKQHDHFVTTVLDDDMGMIVLGLRRA